MSDLGPSIRRAQLDKYDDRRRAQYRKVADLAEEAVEKQKALYGDLKVSFDNIAYSSGMTRRDITNVLMRYGMNRFADWYMEHSNAYEG